MSDEEWSSPFVRCLGMLLSGDTVDVCNFQGEPVRDQTFLFLLNAHYESISFVLPGEEHLEWRLIIDTSDEDGFVEAEEKHPSGDDLELEGRSAKLLLPNEWFAGAGAAVNRGKNAPSKRRIPRPLPRRKPIVRRRRKTEKHPHHSAHL